MKRSVLVITFMAVCLCLAQAGVCENSDYDPFKRNLIVVEGQAEMSVPVNEFKLTFGFDLQRATFSEAEEESSRIIDAMDSKVKVMGLKDYEIIKGWDIVKQAKISLGQSGSKLSNEVIIKVKDFPLDKLHQLITGIIDKSLAISKDVYLKNVEVGLSEELENSKKEEVMATALKTLKSNAEKVAQSQGLSIVTPKRIYATSNQAVVNQMVADKRYGSSYDEMALERSVVSIRKGFVIRSEITDHITLAINVSGVYEIGSAY